MKGMAMTTKYKIKRLATGDRVIIKEGHTMFMSDVVKELNDKDLLEKEVRKLKANSSHWQRMYADAMGILE